jgi:hypothetical protein
MDSLEMSQLFVGRLHMFINYTIADKKGQWIEGCDGM